MKKKIASLTLIAAVLSVNGLPLGNLPLNNLAGIENAYAAAPGVPTASYTKTDEYYPKVSFSIQQQGIAEVTSYKIYLNGVLQTTIPFAGSTTPYTLDINASANKVSSGPNVISISAVNSLGEESGKAPYNIYGTLHPDQNLADDVTYVSPSGIEFKEQIYRAAGEFVITGDRTTVVHLPSGQRFNLANPSYSRVEGVTKQGIVAILNLVNDGLGNLVGNGVQLYDLNTGKYKTISGINASYSGSYVNNGSTVNWKSEYCTVAVEANTNQIAVGYDYKAPNGTKNTTYYKTMTFDLNTGNKFSEYTYAPSGSYTNLDTYGNIYQMEFVGKQLISVHGYTGKPVHGYLIQDASSSTLRTLVDMKGGYDFTRKRIGNTRLFANGSVIEEMNESGQFISKYKMATNQYLPAYYPNSPSYTKASDSADKVILIKDSKVGLYNLISPANSAPVTQQPTLAVSELKLLESAANDGSISTKQTITVANGTLSQDITTGVTVNNLPAGLATTINRLSDTQFEIVFSGNATNHANSNDVKNASVTVEQNKIVGATGPISSQEFAFDFNDPEPKISMQYPTIKESGYNDGALGSIQSILLTNGTFTSDATSGVTITGVPDGISASVSKWSDTQLNISFSGKATNHTNSNDTTISVSIDKSKVTGATANLTGSFAVDFDDPAIAIDVSHPVVTESDANDGSITTKQIVTLQNGGTFTTDAASATQVTNLPSGITISVNRLNEKQLEITFLGKATNHTGTNDKNDVLILIPQSKVVGASGALIKTFKIDFVDPTARISASKSVLAEDATNDGSVTEKQIITLKDGTFATDIVSGTTVTNVPAGLTANVVRVNDTQLEISFIGKAAAHENINDVSNIQVNIDQSKVANATQNLSASFGIDFQDESTTFEVSNLQAVIVNDTVNLSWNAANGADSYLVERYADGIKEKARTVTTTMFVDDTAIAGMNYEYRVTPKKGTEIGTAKSVMISTPIDLEDGGETDPTYGGEPQVEDGNSIRIPLNIPGAVRYEVIRNGTEVYDGPGPEFVDKNLQAGVTYRYKVIGYDAQGNPVDSENQDVKIEDQTIQNLKATDIQKDRVTLTFDAINGVSNYIVERYKGDLLEKRSAAYTNSFTDLTVTANTDYTYKVKAVINGNQTIPASLAVKTLVDTTEPVVNTVTVSTSDVTHKSVNVSWNAELRYDKVVVTRDGQVVYTGAPASSWYFTDNNLEAQTTYEYTVEVFDSKGNITGKETISVTTQEEPPAEAGDENFYASDVQINKVTLTWKPVDGASYYMLYRFNGTKQEFAKIVYAPKISFTDTTVSGGITYKYKLVPKIGIKFAEPLELEVATKTAALPAVPSLNSVTVVNGVVKVKATNNDTSASLYAVIYDEKGTLKVRTSISSGVEKEIKNLAAGNYSVKVEAYNRTYRNSSYSESQPVAITSEMVTPPVPQNLAVSVQTLDATYTLVKSTVDAINDEEVGVYFYLYAPDGKLVSNALGKNTIDGKIGWEYRGSKATLVPGQYKVVTKSMKFSKYSTLVEKTFTIE